MGELVLLGIYLAIPFVLGLLGGLFKTYLTVVLVVIASGMIGLLAIDGRRSKSSYHEGGLAILFLFCLSVSFILGSFIGFLFKFVL